MLRTYTFDEVLSDISQLEEVKFKVDDYKVPEIEFIKLYSEYYDNTPTSEDSTADDLLEKLKEYTFYCGIPDLDELPDIEHDCTLYMEIKEDKFTKLADGSCDKVANAFSEVPDSVSRLLVYNSNKNEFNYLSRNVHWTISKESNSHGVDS